MCINIPLRKGHKRKVTPDEESQSRVEVPQNESASVFETQEVYGATGKTSDTEDTRKIHTVHWFITMTGGYDTDYEATMKIGKRSAVTFRQCDEHLGNKEYLGNKELICNKPLMD